MNDTTPAIGPIRSIEKTPSLLLKINSTQSTTQGYVQPAAGTWSGVRARRTACEREQFAFTQNSTGLVIRCKNEIILVPDAHQWKWVLTCREIPFDERRFLSREPHSWQCRHVPSLSATDTSNKYVGTVCIWKQILWDFSHSCLDQKSVGKKK